MLILTILKIALLSLWGNKLRSMLAMLGIVFGVAAVIAMMAIGAGGQKSVLDRFSAMGTNVLVISPGQRGTGGVMSGTAQNLTLDDADALLKIEHVKQVSPVVRGSAQVKYFNKNSRTSLLGVAATYFPMRSFDIEQGRAFSEAETERHARVAVLGPQTAIDLFGVDDPLGEVVKLNGLNFRVTGVMKAKGDQGWFNPDDQIVIPYTTAMSQVLGVTNLREIDIDANNMTELTSIQTDGTALLRKRHRTQPGAPEDFNIRNQAEMLEMFTASAKTTSLMLGGTAGIALLVGGIGIMNIMLVTVTERTREIGVRKAIGAKERHILLQFLIEAVFMSGLGGVMGALLGPLMANRFEYYFKFPTLIESNSIVLAIGFAAGVGIVFGFFPALRASRLNPIDALRYE